MRNKLQLRVQLAGLLAVLWSYAVALPAQQFASIGAHTVDYESFATDPLSPLQETKELKSVLEQLQNQYDVFFTYDADLLENHRVRGTNFDVNKQAIEEVLSSYLAPLNLTFRKTGDQYYVIYPKESEPIQKINRLDTRVKSTEQQPWLSSTVVEMVRSHSRPADGKNDFRSSGGW